MLLRYRNTALIFNQLIYKLNFEFLSGNVGTVQVGPNRRTFNPAIKMLPLINFEVKFEIDRLIKTVALTCAQPDCDRSFELQHGSRGLCEAKDHLEPG
jgi:hypothetical protein